MNDDRAHLIGEHSLESQPNVSINYADDIAIDVESVNANSGSSEEYTTDSEYEIREKGDDTPSAQRSNRTVSFLDKDKNHNRRSSVANGSKRRHSRTTSLRQRSHSFKTRHQIGNSYRHAINVTNSKSLSARERALETRYKYYGKLGNSTSSPNREHFLMPAHIVPPSFYLLVPFEPGVKQSSLVTIFAIGNLMIGTSVLSMPWAIQQAGLLLGTFIILFMCALCCYTCLLIVDLTFTYEKQHNKGRIADFSDVCECYLGRAGKWVAVVCSLLALMGAVLAYWILMSNFIYNDVTFVTDMIRNTTVVDHSDDYTECICQHNSSFYYTCFPQDNSSGLMPKSDGAVQGGDDLFSQLWNQTKTVPFFLIFLIFPLINFKSPTFFTKFNSLGTVSVIYIIAFLIMKASTWGINIKAVDYPQHADLTLFGTQFAALSGIAMLAFFTHNACVTILRNQKNPENNTRDVILGYMVGLTTYLSCGLLLFLSFPIDKDCIESNLLDNFLSSDVFGFVGRVFLFFQLSAVFPLILYVIRVQFFYSFFHTTTPTYLQIIALNASCVGIGALVAWLIPDIGTVTRFSGGISGALYVTILPCCSLIQRQRADKKLTKFSVTLHVSICVIGVANLIAQFFV